MIQRSPGLPYPVYRVHCPPLGFKSLGACSRRAVTSAQKISGAGCLLSRASRARQSCCEVSPPSLGEMMLSPQRAWNSEHQAKEGYIRTLSLNSVCSLRFSSYLGPVSPFFLVSPVPFGLEVFVLCLPHHCILEACNLFGFTSSHLEWNLTQGELCLEFHLYLI